MPKGKGLSFAQKQERLLESMRNKNEFFIFKEIEKLAKNAGIVPQATKEVLQSLLDDDLVLQDRVGLQNIYWSLVADTDILLDKAIKNAIAREENFQNELENFNAKLVALQKEASENDKNPENESPEKLDAAEKELKKMKEELAFLTNNTPEKLQQKIEEIQIANQAIQRWTDNICTVRQWIKNRTGMPEKVINKQFGIPTDIDEEECEQMEEDCDSESTNDTLQPL